jgi:hypothetical protein
VSSSTNETKFELFDHLSNLTEKKIPFDVQNDSQVKSYDPYIINRFISMCEFYTPLVNEINKYDVPKSIHYQYFFGALPKRKTYFNYIKSKKDKDSEDIDCVMKYYECSKKDAIHYLTILTDDQVETIKKKFEGGRK